MPNNSPPSDPKFVTAPRLIVPAGPTKKMGFGLLVVYVFAYLGVWMAALTPIVISLPIRVRQIDPEHYIGDLSLILAIGALLAMLANPFFGRLSDRTTSRFGMRRPWLIVGAISGLFGTLVMALIPSIFAVAIGWCITQIAINILLAVTTAILPDQIPAEQRGTVSGYMSMCIGVAPVVGTLIVQHFLTSPLWLLLVPAMIMAIGSLLFSVLLKDRTLKSKDVAPYGLRDFLGSFWVDWFRYPDFTWMWLSRFLRFLSVAFLLSYQAYFVTDHLGKSTVEMSGIIVLSMAINAIFSTVGANLAGFVSDRIKQRKMFVVAGSILYSLGLCVLSLSNSLPLFYLAIAITGLGQGVFIAMDFAIIVDVLPEAGTNAAKNLGVFNIANALPQSIAPAIAPSILGIGGGNNYAALFAVAGLIAITAAAFVPLVRKVR